MATTEQFPFVELVGEKIKLTPINVAEDIEELYKNSHGDETLESIWQYLPYGPFSSLEEMRYKYEKDPYMINSATRIYVVNDLASKQKIGVITFLNIVHEHKRVEIGGIWYTPRFHRTYANTESCYLLMKYSFEHLKYRRVEWKCNNDNKKSYNAALGLGFSFEGVFRQHMVVKGKNRDTAWFSVIDGEWDTVKKNLLAKLDKYNNANNSSNAPSSN